LWSACSAKTSFGLLETNPRREKRRLPDPGD
jgi:hypothetical protein